MHIYLETTASPVSAVISASSQNICEGDQVQFNASLSTNATTYEWYTQGANPNYSTNLSVNADYNNSGVHTTYLRAYNSCGFSNLDSIVILFHQVLMFQLGQVILFMPWRNYYFNGKWS